jgi:ankyrin repeat protein
LAAEYGYVAVIKLLLAKDGVDPDSEDNDGWTPLSRAADNGREAVVKLLLATNRVDPDSKGIDGRTPLSLAATKGYETVIKLLLATNRVDPDSKAKDGRTPLMYAALGGHEAVVKLLLARNDVNPDSKHTETSHTPLSIAAAKGHKAVIKLLLATNRVDPDSRAKNGRTPLAYAALEGHEAVVNLLLEAGAVADAQDREYRLMLQEAAYSGKHTLILLLNKFQINFDASSGIFEDALQLGCIMGHMAVVEQLMSLGANPNKVDRHGWTPLLCASGLGQAQIQEYLLLNGGDRDLLSDVSTIRPNSWSKIDKSTSLQADENSRCVRYCGKLKDPHVSPKFCVLSQLFVTGVDDSGTGKPAAALILANHPVPLQPDSFYFEIEILDSGDTG